MKKKKWTKKRHQLVMALVRIVIKPLAWIKFKFKYEKLNNKKTPYLIFYNHQTVWDQFLVGLMCSNKTYYVMSDDLTTIKFASRVLNFLLHPIPYKKSSTDFTILRVCRQVGLEGGSIAISPEGNRTYSGKTEYIKFSTIKMVKFLKLPLAILHIKGGYGAFPRWSNKSRKGKIEGSVYKIYQYEEYKDIPDEKLYQMICDDLYVDESILSGPFKSKRSAEYLERVIYNCPQCGFTHFKSNKDLLKCTTCNMTLRYNEFKQFEGIDCQAPFKNVNEWYEYQIAELFKLELLSLDTNKVLFEDQVRFFEIIPRKKKKLIDKNAILIMYSNRIEVVHNNTIDIYMFDEMSSSGVFGKNKVNFFLKDKTYQFKGDVSFNAVKYVNLYYKYKIEKGEEKDDKFLGL